MGLSNALSQPLNPTSGLTALSLDNFRNAQKVKVLLGRSYCRHFSQGILDVQPFETAAFNAVGDTSTAWVLRPSPDYCTLLLWQRSLTPALQQLHFGREWLTMKGSVRLREVLTTRLAKSPSFRPGEYRFKRTKDYFVLVVPLTW